jgi:sigma-B regulation protein RsbU (phosphoserine phosphatase)
VGILIGDVADKGVPSAIFMARAHALITAEAVHGSSPDQILQRVRQHLKQLEQSERFATVIFGILEPETGEFEFARAGHELPLLVTLNGQVCLLTRGLGQAISMLESPRLDENKVTIPPGGTLLLFSDGMTDGRNPKGEPFGRERLGEGLAKLSGLAAQAVCDRLVRCLQEFQSAAPQDEDITLFAIHSAVSRS